MNPIPAYPAAHAASGRIHEHFAHLSGGRGTPVPDAATIASIIDAAFWASLHREEGFTPRISLAWLPPDAVPAPMTLSRRIALDPVALTKLSPAVERPGIHLGVWREAGELGVWGATRTVPPHCFILEVFAPGLLVVKQSRAGESGKFVNVAVLQGDVLKVIDERAATVPDCPALLTSLLGLESQFAGMGALSVLIQLAVSVRAHGRGGTLLVVPAGSEAWRDSILQPITYSVDPPFAALADLMLTDPAARAGRHWQDKLTRAVEGIAGLTAVDGAAVITSDYQLLAFGAKILRKSGSVTVGQVIATEPVVDSPAITADPAQIGGTRHLSAAQFVHDQRDTLALVASQDGRFTVFAWSPCEGMVHAHRIDSLLL